MRVTLSDTPVWRPEHAISNLRIEMTADWYRDPWGWPEYEFLLSGNMDWLTRRAESSGGLRRVVKIDVPKENFGIRPAVIIEPLDRVLYQTLVDSVSGKLIGDLSSWVHGWRLSRSEPITGLYRSNVHEWRKYRRHLKSGALFCDCGLKSDIVSCFSSIPVDRVCEDIGRLAGGGKVTDRLIDMLQSFDVVPGRGGLAQRSTASAVLANMYLERLRYPLDDHIKQYKGSRLSSLEGARPVLRWMDDLWLFGNDEAQLRSIQVDLQEVAREAELELNLGKTKLLTGDDLWNTVSHVEHSAVDAAIKLNPPDMEPLGSLLDQIIADPEHADRTTIRFAMTRMRDQEFNNHVGKLIEATPHMPHGADHIARAFRDFGIWRTHEDWFLDYADGPWSKISWSVAQLGTIFPTQMSPSARIIEKFAKFVLDRSDFSLLSLALQRMAVWNARTARELLREVLKVADHPQERRVIALAAAAAQDETTFIRRVLGEYEENRLTLAALEARGFAPFDPVPDFGADESDLR